MSSPELSDLLSGVRLGKFASVGVVGSASDFTVLLVLTELFGVPAFLANIASIETAILVMFLINDRWTFAEEGGDDRRSFGGRLLRSHVVRAGGSTVQYVIFVAVFYQVDVALSYAGVDLWLVAVKGGAIACAMVINYTFESFFTWRVHEE